MKDMLKILRKKYNSSSFDISEDESFTTLLFSDKALKNDDDFFDFVYELAYECLPCEKQVRFAVVFDYLNEIDKIFIEKATEREEINFGKLKDETFKHNVSLQKVNALNNFHFTSHNSLTLRDSFDKMPKEKILERENYNNWLIGAYNIINSITNIDTKERDHFDFNNLQVYGIRNLNSKEYFIH